MNMLAVLRIAAMLCTLSGSAAALAPPLPEKSIAFDYAAALPVGELSQFARVVIDPDRASASELSALRAAGVEPIAYVSIGERDPDRAWSRAAAGRWRLGKNAAWHTEIMDPRQAGWRALVLEELARLWGAGHRAFFLDTVDSYAAAVHDDAGKRECVAALAALLTEAHRRLPGVALLLNRGFELLPEVAPLVAGVVAESLFAGWDAAAGRYVAVEERARRWLVAALAEVRDRYHLPAIVVDYVPPTERARAVDVARRIAALGLTPYVGDGALRTVGVGLVEPVPRRILVVYDGGQSGDIAFAEAHQLAAAPLEHLGYALEYADARQPLPDDLPAARYAGVVTWFADDALPRPGVYRRWLERQLDAGIPIAIVDHLGVVPDTQLLARLGLEVTEPMRAPAHVVRRSPIVGFEMAPEAHLRDVRPWRAAAGGGLVEEAGVADDHGHGATLVGIGTFGGLALAPFVVGPSGEGHLAWVLDPFQFFRRALRLGAMPALDVTTGNGRRLLTVHVDGDGFASRAELPGHPYAGQVVLERVLAGSRLPTTVSVIEGEIGPAGVHPDESPALEAIARRIFALPNVELASHSFSHPLAWPNGALQSRIKENTPLAIPGYQFDLTREIDGSVAYIDERLAPPHKRVRVFLWSGDALPDGAALERVARLGLRALNGGDTGITSEHPSLTEVSALARPVADKLAVYAPVDNENIYTNLWRGPFYGYRSVLETFALTGAPRRLRPISIYYHFYSGSKLASLRALGEVYRWAEAQETLPVYASEYVDKVQELYRASWARTLDGGWQLRGARALRTARIDRALGWPDLSRSIGVAGVRDVPEGRYVSFAGDVDPVLYLQAAPPSAPYLESANAELVRWQRRGDAVSLRLRGHLPVELVVATGERHCVVRAGGRTLAGEPRGAGRRRFVFTSVDSGEATLACD